MQVQSSYFVSEQCIQGYWPALADSVIVKDLYHSWHQIDWQDTYFVLHMPAIGYYHTVDLPTQAKRVMITCHIEPIDIDWLRQIALSRPDCQICVLYDGLFAPPSSFYPDNCTLLPWLSWHFQLRRMAEAFGSRTEISRPKFWASSLCNRSTQFKLYVTAHCLLKEYNDKMLISYHGIVDKASDIDHLRTGHTVLDNLADVIERQKPVLIDSSTRSERDFPSISNRDWRFPQHTDCVFNFTNEGFHYSFKSTAQGCVVWPGPDLSEKTFKAILAGQALLPVGQWRSLAALKQLGFRFDYNLDFSYDEIQGDIDRILACLDAIDAVMTTDLDQLHSQTLESRQHNVEWATSSGFADKCSSVNEQSLHSISRWISGID